MNNETLNQILMLNKRFYQSISEEFSSTRQNTSKGWGRVGEYLKRYEGRRISVLDLGCGNGRFYDFLSNNTNLEFDYLGIDQDTSLIEEARKKYGDHFEKKDVLNLEGLTKEYDLIVGFGITHHLPSFELRRRWFRSIAHRLEHEGTAILTFWDFDINKEVFPQEIDRKQLDVNDHFLTWNNRPDIFRYCHKYSEEEIEAIKELYAFEGITVADEFFEDGKNGKTNRYIFFCYA